MPVAARALFGDDALPDEVDRVPRELLVGEKLKHPYGIAPCFPGRLNRARSIQLGAHHTETPRIRYAVPTTDPAP